MLHIYYEACSHVRLYVDTPNHISTARQPTCPAVHMQDLRCIHDDVFGTTNTCTGCAKHVPYRSYDHSVALGQERLKRRRSKTKRISVFNGQRAQQGTKTLITKSWPPEVDSRSVAALASKTYHSIGTILTWHLCKRPSLYNTKPGCTPTCPPGTPLVGPSRGRGRET